ncbi:WD40 repeat domain-containing protein [Subtercola vilae]|nr:WD40 repeat domain-containing protein [Subtercola vilae]
MPPLEEPLMLQPLRDIVLSRSISDVAFVNEHELVVADVECTLFTYDWRSGTATLRAHHSDVLRESAASAPVPLIQPLIAVEPGGSVVVSPHDGMLVSKETDGLWRVLTETTGMSTPAFSFSPTGDYFAMAAEGELRVWNMRDPSQYTVDDVDAFTWAPSTTAIVVLLGDGRLQALDARSGTVVHEVGRVEYGGQARGTLGTNDLAILGSGILVVALEGWSIDFWNLSPFSLVKRHSVVEAAESVFTSEEGDWFVTESDHMVRFWDSETLTEVCEPLGKPARQWQGIRFSPSGELMVTIGMPEMEGTGEFAFANENVRATVWRVIRGQ